MIRQHCSDTYFSCITKKTFCVFIVFTTMSFHRNYIFGQGPSGVVPGSTLRELGEVFCVGIGGQIVELVRGV